MVRYANQLNIISIPLTPSRLARHQVRYVQAIYILSSANEISSSLVVFFGAIYVLAFKQRRGNSVQSYVVHPISEDARLSHNTMQVPATRSDHTVRILYGSRRGVSAPTYRGTDRHGHHICPRRIHPVLLEPATHNRLCRPSPLRSQRASNQLRSNYQV